MRGGHATSAGPGTRDDGGGIFVDDDPSDATLFLSNALVTANRSDHFGAGVDVDGEGTLTNVTISGNTAEGGGGGGMEVEGTGTLTNVTVSGDRAEEDGGGVAMFGDSLTINNSTITGNTADSENTDNYDGGGIFVDSPQLLIRNTIVAGNTDATSSPGTIHPDCSAPVPTDLVSQGHNLVGSTAGGRLFTGPGDLTGMSPLLGPLADNGGTTPTRALLPGSPAIDAGDPGPPGSGGTACAATDQRGLPRNCDIGSYELALCATVPINRIGGGGTDVLTGTAGPDGFLAGGGNDRAKGLGGSDAACMGPGKDIAAGGSGKDFLRGDAGKDLLKGQGGRDRLKGGPGKDTCLGGPGRDRAGCETEKKVP